MATNPMPSPDPGQGAAPQGGGTPPDPSQSPTSATSQDPSQQSPSQAPANQLQMILAQWYRAAQDMASADPRLASGAQKVADGIREMQSAIVVPQQPTPTYQQPK